MIQRLTQAELVTATAGASRLLIACDLDGTLCRIAPRPDLVFVPEETRETLLTLSSNPDILVAIVSGRRLEDLDELVGLPLTYAGNHGLEIRGPDFSFEHPEATANAGLLEEACKDLDRAISKWHGAWVERKRLTATVHFRNVPADEQHHVAMTVRRTVSCFGGSLGLRAGKRALEVRPRVEWHKGSAVDYIRRQAGFEDALCICIGDDVTDETMFRSFPDHLTIRVGWHAGSAAQYYVEDPAGVRELLDLLSQPARLDPIGVSVTC